MTFSWIVEEKSKFGVDQLFFTYISPQQKLVGVQLPLRWGGEGVRRGPLNLLRGCEVSGSPASLVNTTKNYHFQDGDPYSTYRLTIHICILYIYVLPKQFFLLPLANFSRNNSTILHFRLFCVTLSAHSFLVSTNNGRPVFPKTRPLANVAFSSAKCQTNEDDI